MPAPAIENKTDDVKLVEATADDVRRVLGDFLDRAGFQGERIIITRHGKQLAAIVGIPDLRRLQSFEKESADKEAADKEAA